MIFTWIFVEKNICQTKGRYDKIIRYLQCGLTLLKYVKP